MIGIEHRTLEEWMQKSNSNTRPIQGGVCWKGEIKVEFGHGKAELKFQFTLVLTLPSSKSLNYPKDESLIDIILPQYVTHGLK